MAYYKSLGRAGKIQYVRRVLPRNLSISYQNEIAKRLIPIFNPNTYSGESIAGQQKVLTQLIILETGDRFPLPGQKIQTPPPSGKRDIMRGIITKDGFHISSYPITEKQLKRLEADGYWVL